MYYKSILENIGILKYVSDCCKNQQMCDKEVDIYLNDMRLKNVWSVSKAFSASISTINFVPECLRIQEMCE